MPAKSAANIVRVSGPIKLTCTPALHKVKKNMPKSMNIFMSCSKAWSGGCACSCASSIAERAPPAAPGLARGVTKLASDARRGRTSGRPGGLEKKAIVPPDARVKSMRLELTRGGGVVGVCGI